MVYEPIEDGEELVVLGECEVLEAHEFDISNCDVMEFESMEEEEDPAPAPPTTQAQAEPSSKQQIIVRHTKKGKQIVMVKRGEEGKDQRQIVYRTEKEVTPREVNDCGEVSKDKSTEISVTKVAEPQFVSSQGPMTSVVRVSTPTRVSAATARSPTPTNTNSASRAPTPTNISAQGRAPTPTNVITPGRAPTPTTASTVGRAPTPTALGRSPTPTNTAVPGRAPTPTSTSVQGRAPTPINITTGRAPTPTNTNSASRAPTPTTSTSVNRVSTPTICANPSAPTPISTRATTTAVGTSLILSSTNSRAPVSGILTPTQTSTCVPTTPTRLVSTPVRTVPSPSVTPPPNRPVVSPTSASSNPLLTRLVASPVPVRTVPSPSVTPPPYMRTSPSVTSTPVRLVSVPVASPTVVSSPLRLVTSPNISSSHLRLVTSPSAISSPSRLVTAAGIASPPARLVTSPNLSQTQMRLVTSQSVVNVQSSTGRLGTMTSPTRLVTSPNAISSSGRLMTSSNVIMPLNRPVTVPSSTPASSRTLMPSPNRLAASPQCGLAPATLPSAFAVSAVTDVPPVTHISSVATLVSTPQALSVAPNVISVVPAEVAAKTSSLSEMLLQSDVKPTVLTMTVSKKEESKPTIPTLSFPDFPEGLASKFMSAECSVIKKPEMTEVSPIRAAKTYEKSRHGKQKIPLTEHDYTSSQKPTKMEIDETDITSHIAKIDPKVRDIISISKITQDSKKIDRRKSMETISKRKGIEERRRSSENKRELEQRRLMILEEIKQEKKAHAEGAQVSVQPQVTIQPPLTADQTVVTAPFTDVTIKSDNDFSEVIDILENIDSATPTRLLSSSEIQSIEKTPLFENEELEKSPVKPKADEKINIQSLLNESGKSDLQMSDLARNASKTPVAEPRPAQPPPGSHSKLAALLTGGKVPTLESLLEKDIEDDQKKVEPTVDVKPEPNLLLSPTSGIMRNSQSLQLAPAAPPPTQQHPPDDQMADVQKDMMPQQGTQTEATKSIAGATLVTSSVQYVTVSQQHNPPLTYHQNQQAQPLTQHIPLHQQQQFNFPQAQQPPISQEQFQQQMQHQSLISQPKPSPQEQQQQQQQQLMAMGHVQTHHHSQAPRFQLVASNPLQRLSVPSAVMSTSIHPSRIDESQNVLLKQLLQNTGCAGGASSPGLPRSPTPSTPSPITSPTIKKEPMDTVEMKQESAEDIKKLKRRQYQQKRRQSQGKEGGTPKKRARKGSRMEEDYESYTEGLMSQLKQLLPLAVMEPSLPRNFGVCPVFGSGESPLPAEDFYSTKPFGDDEKVPPRSPVTTQRGFYDQVIM